MSTAEILTIFEPNPDAMRQHLDELFPETFDQPEGLIELAWTDPKPNATGRYALSHARQFRLDQKEELIARACRLNKREKCNVYVGAALRKLDTPLHGRTSEEAFLSVRAVWADLDDAGSVERARDLWTAAPPSFVVQTGQHPHLRWQPWWMLDAWEDNTEALKETMGEISGTLGSDPSVVQAGRVMRLAGSIAWDIKKGRVPELTSIISASGREYRLDHVAEGFRQRSPAASPATSRDLAPRASNVVREVDENGREGKVIDGRETHMRNLSCAVLMEMMATDRAVPSKQELFDKAWPLYERSTDLTREGRGRDEFRAKCGQTLRRFERGVIPGMRTLEEAIETYNTKRMAEFEGDFEDLGEDLEAKNLFADLEREARLVGDHEAYGTFCDKVRRLGDRQITSSMRSSLGVLLHSAFAKGVGMSVAEVKKDLKRSVSRESKKAKAVRTRDEGAEGSEGGGASMPEWMQDWVFSESDNTFERVTVRHSVKREAWRMMFDRMPEVISSEVDAVTFASVHCRIPTVSGLMYWPGAGVMFEGPDKLLKLNSFMNSGVLSCDSLESDADGQAVADMFMQHIRNTIRSEHEQRIVLDYMAYVLQNLGKRVNWALLLHGIEGNGKSYLYNVMQYALGTNARVVSTTAINSEFTGWAEGAILIGVEEIRIAGTNKYGILDKMKPMLTNDTIAVVHKGRDEKTIPNFASYMMMTNHADAIPVGDNDRRYCVISTRHTRKEELYEQHGGPEGVAKYFNRLFSETARRPDAIIRFLLDWKISADFNPKGRAPETDGLLAMRSLHVSEERDEIESLIEKYACPVIGPDLIDVTELRKQALIDGTDLPQGRVLAHILSDMGYTQIPGRKVKMKDRTNHRVWFRVGPIEPQEAIERARRYNENGPDIDDVPF